MAARQEPEHHHHHGCGRRLLVLCVLVLLAGFAAALWFIAQPQDMARIAGYRGVAPAAGRDLARVLQNSIEGGYKLTLTEDEINRYLQRTLAARQGGLLARWVSLDGAAVRLEQDRAEVVLVRSVAGRPFTVSMFLSIDQAEAPDGRVTTYLNRHGGRYLEQLPFLHRGGRFGRLVVPQGFLVLVLGSFERLAAAYQHELSLAFEEMARIRFEPHQLVLDPNPPAPAAIGGF